LGFAGLPHLTGAPPGIRAVALDAGDGCVEPSAATVASGEYGLLTRPLFLYVSREALERRDVRRFLEYTLSHGRRLVAGAGSVPLTAEAYAENLRRVRAHGRSD
jgi:phosphate transport system substrate-binding protein